VVVVVVVVVLLLIALDRELIVLTSFATRVEKRFKAFQG